MKYIETSADLDGIYRYSLLRVWDAEKPRCGWLMCNPSDADASQDDPTVRKVVGFSERWGCGSAEIVNLCAFRATNPKDLRAALRAHGLAHVRGPRNVEVVEAVAARCTLFVFAWGAVGHEFRDPRLTALVRTAAPEVVRLGDLTASGDPKHPLMLGYDSPRNPHIYG